MLTRRHLSVALLAVALAGTAACSSSGDSGSSATTAAATTAPGATAAPTTVPVEIPTTTIAKSDLPPCPVDALAKATAPVQITFWHAMNNALQDTLVSLTDQYNASQSKVKVTLVNQTGYDQNLDKYRTATAADRPQIVQLSETAVQLMVDSKTAIPVQSCIDAEKYDTSDYLERVTNFYSIGGALFPMPFNVSNPVLFYNKQAFTKAGLDPEKPPTTLEEVRADSEKLVSSGATTFGLAVDTGTDSGGGWFVEQWFAKAGKLYANNNNGRTERATAVTFGDDPLGPELLGWLQKMQADKLAVNVGANNSGQDTLLKLADAKEPAAMSINTSAAISSVMAVLATGGYPQVTLGVGPMPGPAGDGGVLVGGASLWLVKGKTDAETAASWDFMKYLTSPATQAAWSVGTGYVPIRKSSVDEQVIKDAWAKTPELKVAYDQLVTGTANAATAGAVLGPQRAVREAVAKATESVLAGGDPAKALADAAAASNALLEDYAKRTG